ncbi:MAG: cation:proton antiporter [Pseudomonadota bacterium]
MHLINIPDTLLSTLFIIYGSAAIFATLALFTRQSLLVTYMILGMIIGPYGFKLLPHTGPLIKQTGDMGIIFLLFLLGLQLHPQKLLRMFRETIVATIISSALLMVLGFTLGNAFGFNLTESLIIGATMMFSSTIIGLKLMPQNYLNNHRTGEVVISVLLLQDIIAIAVLIAIHIFSTPKNSLIQASLMAATLPILCLTAYLMQRFVLTKLIQHFKKIYEYTLLLSIGWCITMAVLAEVVHLSGEIGAFIAGVALATSKSAEQIARNLRPLRDFFLVLFFFAIGAQFDYHALPRVITPALTLAIVMLVIKPLIFRISLNKLTNNKTVIWESSIRLGQISEFALLIVYLAQNLNLISNNASYVVQAATIISFIISSYIIIFRYPTPMAFSKKLYKG